MLWEHEPQAQLFWVLLNFHECLYNAIEPRSKCFLFLLENTATRKRTTTCELWLSKSKFSLLEPSLRQQRELVLWIHRVIQTRLLYSWRFSRYSASFHWLVHGHMTSNNETVSRQMPWAGNIESQHRISMFPPTSSRETLRFSGNKIHCSPRDQSLSVYWPL